MRCYYLLHIPNIPTEEAEWGLLGIAIDKSVKDASSPTHVFLYYTEKGTRGEKPANHLYRYTLSPDDAKLEHPLLLLNLPANSPNPQGESNHNGGKVLIGPDHNVYTVVGDVGGHRGQAQNNMEGSRLDGTSGVLRITQDGQPVSPNPLGIHDPTKVYAYGIRNSFGIDFDPISSKLWGTENGPTYGDEINLILPGFNSGWNQVMGIWHTNGLESGATGPVVVDPEKGLVIFDGKGKYRSPEFVWKQTVGPTALKFLNSDKLGKEYENTMFVGNVNTGDLYNFRLNEDRTSLLLGGPLEGKVANNPEDLKPVIFGHGFGTITDIAVGPK